MKMYYYTPFTKYKLISLENLETILYKQTVNYAMQTLSDNIFKCNMLHTELYSTSFMSEAY